MIEIVIAQNEIHRTLQTRFHVSEVITDSVCLTDVTANENAVRIRGLQFIKELGYRTFVQELEMDVIYPSGSHGLLRTPEPSRRGQAKLYRGRLESVVRIIIFAIVKINHNIHSFVSLSTI